MFTLMSNVSLPAAIIAHNCAVMRANASFTAIYHIFVKYNAHDIHDRMTEKKVAPQRQQRRAAHCGLCSPVNLLDDVALFQMGR